MTARFCFSNFGRLEVTGREAVPPYGPLIVVSNHLSYTDSPLLVASIPRPLYFICKQGLFSGTIGSSLAKQAHVFPLNLTGFRIDTLRSMLRMVAQDRAVVVFPEGHRSSDHTMQEGMLGVVYLALKSQAPILPVGVSGTEKISAWRMPVPLCRFRANIGPPFTLPVLEGKPSREVMTSLLNMIMTRVANLLPVEYRGVYQTATPVQAQAVGGGAPESGAAVEQVPPP